MQMTKFDAVVAMDYGPKGKIMNRLCLRGLEHLENQYRCPHAARSGYLYIDYHGALNPADTSIRCLTYNLLLYYLLEFGFETSIGFRMCFVHCEHLASWINSASKTEAGVYS